MKTAGRENPNRRATVPDRPSTWCDRSRTDPAQSSGLRSKKNCGRGRDFFLDFYFYRTTQALTKGPSSPTNLECRRWSTYASYCTARGVSHQITGPKTAPCRPGANDSATFKRCMQSSRRTRRNLDCCRIGRTMSHFEHHGCRECDRLPCFSAIKCGSQEVSL